MSLLALLLAISVILAIIPVIIAAVVVNMQFFYGATSFISTIMTRGVFIHNVLLIAWRGCDQYNCRCLHVPSIWVKLIVLIIEVLLYYCCHYNCNYHYCTINSYYKIVITVIIITIIVAINI